MSSILKALRKLEDEKSDMGEGSVDLARDILKRSYAERRSSSKLGVAALFAAILLLVVGWWLFSANEEPQQPKTPADQAVELTTPPSPVVSNKPLKTSQPVVIMPSRPADTTHKTVIKRLKPLPKQEPAAVEEKAATVPGVTVAPITIPDLVIEEIVFVDDPSSRLAVINDLPVMQGTDIDGARVIEIRPDRVRFEYQGVRFDKLKRQKN